MDMMKCNITSDIISNASLCVNTSTFQQLEYSSMQQDPQMRLFLAIESAVSWYQLTVVSLSLLLNIFTLCACSSKSYLSKHKLLIQCLSASDLIYALSEMLYVHRRFKEHEWHLGEILCRFTVIPHASITFSIFVIIFIAWDRYRSIVYPFREKMSNKRQIATVCFLAFGALSLHLPTLLNLRIVDHGKIDCVRDMDPSSAKYWDLLNIFVTLPLPVTIMLYCYVNILRKVYRRFTTISKKSMHVSSTDFHHNKQITLMLTIIVLVFVVTTLPNNTLILWTLYAPKYDPKEARKIFFILYWSSALVHLHCLVNPFIYILNDKRFKTTVKSILKGLLSSGTNNYREKSSTCNVKAYIANHCLNEGNPLALKDQSSTTGIYYKKHAYPYPKKMSLSTQQTLVLSSKGRQSISEHKSSFKASFNRKTETFV
ncbi:C-X-C chemokine receptor type 2-like [Clytia hemisphaerica]|uniref:C-X-C chemokine receptor type 2-like n=1 Tax=Clytia hemisphaerica TaxID=252671 RepID=UPI0034D7156F